MTSIRLTSISEYRTEFGTCMPVKNPYLHPVWIEAMGDMQSAKGMECRILIAERDGHIVMVLPVQIRSILCVRICEALDCGFSNRNTPILPRQNDVGDWGWLPRALKSALPDVSVFIFSKQEIEHGGITNPVAEFAYRATHPNPLYQMEMEDSFADYVASRRSRNSMKTLRKKANGLERECGAISLEELVRPEEAEDYLKSFLEQRAQAQSLGRVPNPFSTTEARSFLLSALKSSSTGKDGLRLFALKAGGQTVATSIVLVCGNTQSGFAHSFDPQFRKFSPGRILEWKMLELQSNKGLLSFDFGLGEDAYKEEWSDPSWLVDTFVPNGIRGCIFMIIQIMKLFGKARIKRSEFARRLLKKLALMC